MRTIKFRGKRKHDNKWVYGYFVGNNLIYNNIYWLEVLPETVGQFTGLKDKNGVEIYEHDKLKWTYESHHLRGGKVEDIIEVKWVNSGWHLGINETYEVIGNIHEERSET